MSFDFREIQFFQISSGRGRKALLQQPIPCRLKKTTLTTAQLNSPDQKDCSLSASLECLSHPEPELHCLNGHGA